MMVGTQTVSVHVHLRVRTGAAISVRADAEKISEMCVRVLMRQTPAHPYLFQCSIIFVI
jgi:hypothetical protein